MSHFLSKIHLLNNYIIIYIDFFPLIIIITSIVIVLNSQLISFLNNKNKIFLKSIKNIKNKIY